MRPDAPLSDSKIQRINSLLGACRELAPSKQESTTYEPSLVCKLLILGCRPLIPDRLLEKTDTAISEFAVKLGCRRRPVYEIIRKCSVRTSENRAQPVAVVFPLFVVLIILLSLSPDFAVGGDKLAHFGAYLLM